MTIKLNSSHFLFLAVLGLCCCERAFSSCGEWRAILHCRARTPHCGGFSCCRAWALEHVGLAVVVHRLSHPEACGISPDQGLNTCPLRGQADS